MSQLTSNQWIADLCMPLTPATGSDPRHSDEFYKIKQEIDKIAGCDYELIEKNCEIILLKHAKDLRVVSYLLLAKLQRQGIPGVCQSLHLYAKLIENFTTALLPEKAEVKIASINWLNEPRLKQLIKNKLAHTSTQSVQELITALHAVNEQLQKNLPQMPGIFTSILASLEAEQLTKQNAAQESSRNANEQPEPRVLEVSQQQEPLPVVTLAPPQCNSESDFKELVELQLNYLYQKGDLFAAVALARAVRWNDLLAPIHHNNVTNVAPPDASVRSQLAYQVQHGTPHTILQSCENVLMAIGGIFYFDAQYYAYHAATNMGHSVLANYIVGELRILLERAPELINLQFSDGTPFIGSQHRAWLEGLLLSKVTNNARSPVKEQLDLSEIVNQLRAKIAGKTLSEKIMTINALPKADQRTKFLHDYALARFCSEEKRVELALPILEQLAQQIEQHQLAQWEPECALTIWLELRNNWKLRQNFLSKDMQKQVEQRLEDLFSQICQTNLERAVDLK